MSGQNQLIVIGKVGIDGCRYFVISKDAGLSLLTLHIEDADLMISATGDQD